MMARFLTRLLAAIFLLAALSPPAAQAGVVPIPQKAYPGILSPAQAARVSADGTAPTFSTGVVDFTPAATPTDVFAITAQAFDRAISVKRVTVSCIADTASTLEVLLQTSSNGGGGTQVALNTSTAARDPRDSGPTGLAYYYTANRTSNGQGVTGNRSIVAVGRMTCATATAAGTTQVFDFGTRGGKAPMIKDLVKWVTVNLNGQTLVSNTKLSIDAEWSEEKAIRFCFDGDSTFSNANFLFNTLGTAGALNSYAIVDNLGSNGYRLTDFLNNTNGVTYPLTQAVARNPEVHVVGYGLNDARQGATTQAAFTTLLSQTIDAIKAANPDAKIILWGPNSTLADDPTSAGFITTTGNFSAMTLAQASQAVTDMLYNAYASFNGDPRIYAVVQRQDVTGRTVKTGANNSLMTDTLHPNQRGQTLLARQIMPILTQAVADSQNLWAANDNPERILAANDNGPHAPGDFIAALAGH